MAIADDGSMERPFETPPGRLPVFRLLAELLASVHVNRAHLESDSPHTQLDRTGPLGPGLALEYTGRGPSRILCAVPPVAASFRSLSPFLVAPPAGRRATPAARTLKTAKNRRKLLKTSILFVFLGGVIHLAVRPTPAQWLHKRLTLRAFPALSPKSQQSWNPALRF